MDVRVDSSEPQASPPYTLVTTDDAFRAMMERLRPVRRLAIDTEADSLYHYFEKVCLLQISTESETFIVDPLAVAIVGELGALMADPAVEKVFHAAGYDVYCLRRDYNFSFANIFDTHLAGSLLGYEFLGLGTMMEEILGVHHSKGCQRDDWSRRPLLAEQLEYAAMDTYHLLRLRDALEEELRQKGRLGWALEEFDAEASAARSEKEFDTEGFRRIKGFRELDVPERLVLRALYLFRDAVARKLDAPAFKVLNNSVLVDLARRPPATAQELFRRPGISYRVARKFGEELVALIRDACAQDPAVLQLPPRPMAHPPSRAARHRMELLKKWRLGKSEELKLQVGVVFPANLLEGLAGTPPESLDDFMKFPGMRRWRVEEFGAEILQALMDDKEGCVSGADGGAAAQG
ncbi:MAG: HRDC domain-containing protein [Acidobacteriota bacterium]|jgi:ribonuclease D|nr:HRDC domain-containing protein [Acidobacteriota bacterium]